jgi:DNA repair protein SbcD/Mre11
MRVLHLADLHLGLPRYGSATPTGNSRIADFSATLNRAVEAAVASEASLVILAGDTFNSRRPGPDELEAVVSALRRLSRDHGIASIVIPGNHDGMTTIGDPRTHALNWLAAADIPDVHVITKPGVTRVEKKNRWALNVFALPYPHKRAFDAILPDLTPEERVVEIGKRVTDAIETLSEGVERPFIFVGHVTVLGARLGTEAAMRIGWDASITPDVLGRFDAAFLGHIHRMQKVAPNAWYPGSPEYIDFAEAGQEKGFLLWDVTPGMNPEVGYMPSGCRPLVDIEVDPGTYEGFPELGGAIVRIRIVAKTRPEPRLVNTLIAEARSRGASYVKTEVKVDAPVTVREREAVAEGDTVEAVRRWLVSHEHAEEPATSIAREMIASLAGQE